MAGKRAFHHRGRLIDPDDLTTWAMYESGTCDAADITLTESQCAQIASILDRATERIAAQRLSDRGGNCDDLPV